jgi:hypothetical protein
MTETNCNVWGAALAARPARRRRDRLHGRARLGWYNEARRNSFSGADMSEWADAGWEPVFRDRPRPDGHQV